MRLEQRIRKLEGPRGESKLLYVSVRDIDDDGNMASRKDTSQIVYSKGEEQLRVSRLDHEPYCAFKERAFALAKEKLGATHAIGFTSEVWP